MSQGSIPFNERYPFLWLYVAGSLVLAGTSAALCFPTGRIIVGICAAAGVALAVPRKYAVALAVVGAIGGFVAVPVIAVQDVAFVVPAAVLGLAILAVVKRWNSLRIPRHFVTVTVYFGLFVASTAAFSQQLSPLWIALLLTACAIPTFFLASNLTENELRVVSIAVFVMLAVEVCLSFAEATRIISAIYSVSADRLTASTDLQQNTIVADWERSTGTLLHALPLSFLAITAAGLATVKTATFRWSRLVRLIVFAMAVATCVFASARSSLIVLALLAILTFPLGRRVAKFLQVALISAAVLMLLIEGGFFESQQVVSLFGSGSVTHRVGIASMVPLLGQEPVLNLFFGSGNDAVNLLRDLMPNDGWLAVDNQFISTMLMTGLIGLVLLVIVLVAAWRNAPGWRTVFTAQLAMFAIFDVVLWQSSLVLLMVVLGAMLNKSDVVPPKSEGDPGTTKMASDPMRAKALSS